MRKKKVWQDQAPAAVSTTVAAMPPHESAQTGDAPWIAAFGLLSIMMAALIWMPLAKIPSPSTAAITEGFNTYYESAAAHGDRIYANPPRYTYANYPPLSYHLIAWLASRNFNVTGRWLSFAAYLAIGVFAALIVHRLSNSWRLGAYAGMCWLVWLAAFDPARVSFNDPHVLGIAFSLAALYCFVRAPESVRWLCLSAVLFAISLFTKHSLVAFPAAVAVQLFLSSRKRFFTWSIAAALACSILLSITLAADGPY